MSIRDEELNRLIKYAQGMGVSVRFKPYKLGSNVEADWATDGTEITIYTKSRASGISNILSLIHELAHHKSFVDNGRKVDPKLEELLDSEDQNKKNRKKILDMEIEDTSYWIDIYRDTNCQFPLWKLESQKELDVWCYEVWHETGKNPLKKEKNKKRRELNLKHKKL